MKSGPKPRPEADRFWAMVNFGDGTICYLWTGHTNGDGYGLFRVGSLTDGTRTKVLAHRWAFHEGHGHWPVNDADHTCHNEDPNCPGGKACLHRRCVRLDHLRDATRSENLAASGRMGRYPR
jgi:hypothetical protein